MEQAVECWVNDAIHFRHEHIHHAVWLVGPRTLLSRPQVRGALSAAAP